MEHYWRVLETNRDRLTAAAIAAEGAAPYSVAIEALTRRLPSLMEATVPETQTLHAAGAAESVVHGVIHALETESLSILREQAPPLSGAEERVMRRAIRRGVTCPALPEQSIGILRRLNGGPNSETTPELAQVAGFLNGVLAATRDIVVICDEQGFVLCLNQKGQEITQYTGADILAGLVIQDLLPDAYLASALNGGASPVSISEPLDTVELLAKDGRLIPVEVSAQDLGGVTGKSGTVFVIRDQRLELQLQREIRHSQVYLEGIIANAPIGIITTDSNFVVLNANPASVALYGAPAANAMIGHALPSLSASVDPEFVAALHDVTQRQTHTRRRYSFPSLFGVTVNCDLLTVPLQATADMQGGVLALMVDISEQITLEQSLIQSEKLQSLGEIMAGVAHELNNPLTGILGYSQLLISAKVDANLKSKLEHITEEATRCRRIVQNLLSFSRRHEPETSLQAIGELLQQTITLREYQLRVDGIQLTVDLDESLPLVLVDPHEIQRVFLNIINNAQQALATIEGRQRTLLISTFVKDGQVHIRFDDNGPGIPKDKVSRVFDPFFTTKGIGEGTGLGLSVSYGIVHAHGGRIALSTTEGQGASFTVILPPAQSDE